MKVWKIRMRSLWLIYALRSAITIGIWLRELSLSFSYQSQAIKSLAITSSPQCTLLFMHNFVDFSRQNLFPIEAAARHLLKGLKLAGQLKAQLKCAYNCCACLRLWFDANMCFLTSPNKASMLLPYYWPSLRRDGWEQYRSRREYPELAVS